MTGPSEELGEEGGEYRDLDRGFRVAVDEGPVGFLEVQMKLPWRVIFPFLIFSISARIYTFYFPKKRISTDQVFPGQAAINKH